MPKRRLSSLKLTHIAAVTMPCQEGAQAVLMKRREDPVAPSPLATSVAKYVCEDDGAHSFDEVLAQNRFSEAIWPLTDAFTQSIRSIMGDKELGTTDRETRIAESVDEFLSAVRSKAPPAEAAKVESELSKLIKQGDPDMKTVEQLEAEIATLKGTHTAAIEVLTGERDTQKARADAAETALATEKTAHGETQKSLAEATDETLKVGDKEVKKSVFGAEQFDVLKAQEERAQLAELSKRAETDFGHVVGTAAEKAQVLKAIVALPEDARKAAEAILESAEKMAASGFDRFGVTGEMPATLLKAKGDFNAKVEEIVARDKCNRTTAMQKARTEHPDLFEAMQEADADA